jgi:hypothetical protein
VGLNKGDNLKKFIERAEPAGETNEAMRIKRHHNFASKKEVKGEAVGGVGVEVLLVWQGYIKANRNMLLIECAAVTCFHYATATARQYGEAIV